MKKITSSDCLYVSKSKISKADRGVFAGRSIKKGEIIERCPMIEIQKNDTALLNKSILVTYFFYFGKDKKRQAIALGFGSIYNHSHSPNAKFKIQEKDSLIEFVSIKNIKKDEEITFNYYGTSPPKSPLWFEVK